MRESKAGGRKEIEQQEALAKVNLHFPGELKTVLCISVKKDLCCAVLRASSSTVLTCLSLFGAKRGRNAKMHRTLWSLPHFIAPRSGVEKEILLLEPTYVPGRAK